ncbi:MAG: 6-carboxytetrahydropterin synthase [Methanobacterium sp.]
MFRIKKSFKLPIGHRLMKHNGLCKNIHGHNIKIDIQLSCHGLDNNDMVMDFGIISNLVGHIITGLDHATLLNKEDEESIKYVKTCGYEDKKLFVFPSDPTAEYLAYWIYDQLKPRIPNKYINLDYVAVWESDDAVAIFDGCEKDVK